MQRIGIAAGRDAAGQTTDVGHARRSERAAVDVLEPRPTGAAQAVGERLRGWHPAGAFAVTTLACYLVLAAVAIGVGFLLIDVLLPFHGLGRSDEHINDWLAAHRSSNLNEATTVGSAIGDIPMIPGIVTLTVIVGAILRRWRMAAFMLGAILVEVATYRVTSLIVHRERPTVPRLDHLPVNQSYPSGHVAASVTVYVALALIVSSVARRRWVTITAWSLALLLPVIVAFSRMDRGMHHLSDATAGALVGISSISIALLAARVSGVVAAKRPTGRRA